MIEAQRSNQEKKDGKKRAHNDYEDETTENTPHVFRHQYDEQVTFFILPVGYNDHIPLSVSRSYMFRFRPGTPSYVPGRSQLVIIQLGSNIQCSGKTTIPCVRNGFVNKKARF